MPDYKKKYEDLYLEVSLLRQAVGEYLTDHNDIYRKLNELAPLVSDKEAEESSKQINKEL
jgi:hypothetical protein